MSFRSWIRRLRKDVRGAAQPFLVVGSVVVFGIVSVGVGSAMQAAMQTAQSSKVNTALSMAVSDLAQRTAANGYTAATELGGSEPVSVSVGNTTVTGLRVVDVDEDGRTAKITVMAGKYAHGDWTDPETCLESPVGCMMATTTATPGLSQSIPKPAGMVPASADDNVLDSREVRWMDAAVGSGHVIAIDGAGELWSWGSGRALGAGGEIERLAPKRVSVAGHFVDVAATDTASFAIDDAGRLFTWGETAQGVLGRAGATADGVPVAIPGDQRWVQVEAGSKSVCAITTEHDLYCWGFAINTDAGGTTTYTTPTQVTIDGSNDGFADVSIGDRHWVAVTTRGKVYSWGKNDVGQLGLGEGGPAAVSVDSPHLVATDDVDTSTLTGARIVDVEAGRGNSYVVDQLGRTWAWGLNDHGQVGDGTDDGAPRLTPVRIGAESSAQRMEGFSNRGAFEVTKTGEILAWGQANPGLFGVSGDQRKPMKVSLLEPETAGAPEAAFLDVYSPTNAANFVFALDSTHRLWLWGSGIPKGMAGDGSAAVRTITKPQQLQMRQPSTGLSAVDVAATETVTASLGTDGNVYTWESGKDEAPEAVSKPLVKPIITASAAHGNAHLDSAGNLWTSTTAPTADRKNVSEFSQSKNALGWISDGVVHMSGTAPSATCFEEDVIVEPVRRLAVGDNFAAALDLEGALWVWGKNIPDGLGLVTADDECVPTKQTNVLAVTNVAVSDQMLAISKEPDGAYTYSYVYRRGAGTPAETYIGMDSRWVFSMMDGADTGVAFAASSVAGRSSIIVSVPGEGTRVVSAQEYTPGAELDQARAIAFDGKYVTVLTPDTVFQGVLEEGEEEGDNPTLTLRSGTDVTSVAASKILSLSGSDGVTTFTTTDGKRYKTNAAGKFVDDTTTISAYTSRLQDVSFEGKAKAIDGAGDHMYAIDSANRLWEIVDGKYALVHGAPAGVMRVVSGGDGSLIVDSDAGVRFRDTDMAAFTYAASPAGVHKVAAANGTFALYNGDHGFFWGDASATPFAHRGQAPATLELGAVVEMSLKDADAPADWTAQIYLGDGLGILAGLEGTAVFGTKSDALELSDDQEHVDGNVQTFVTENSSASAASMSFALNSKGGNGKFIYAATSMAVNETAAASVAAGTGRNSDGTVSSTLLTQLNWVGAGEVLPESMMKIDIAGNHAVAVSDAGFVWQTSLDCFDATTACLGDDYDNLLHRIEASDPNAPWALTPVAEPQVIAGTWKIGTISQDDEDGKATLRDGLQINVRTDLPVSGVMVGCAGDPSESKLIKAETNPSSGDYRYVNVSAGDEVLDELGDCDLVLYAVFNGWPASTAEVSTITVPTVDADGIPEGWD